MTPQNFRCTSATANRSRQGGGVLLFSRPPLSYPCPIHVHRKAKVICLVSTGLTVNKAVTILHLLTQHSYPQHPLLSLEVFWSVQHRIWQPAVGMFLRALPVCECGHVSHEYREAFFVTSVFTVTTIMNASHLPLLYIQPQYLQRSEPSLFLNRFYFFHIRMHSHLVLVFSPLPKSLLSPHIFDTPSSPNMLLYGAGVGEHINK